MNEVFIVVILNEDDSVAEIVSAHPTKQVAISAERFLRMYDRKRVGDRYTDVRNISFEV